MFQLRAMKLPLVWLLLCLVTKIAASAAAPLWIMGSEGIHYADLNEETGALGTPILAASFKGGSWLTEHPSAPILYANWGRSELAAFRIINGHALELIERIELPAGGAAHIAIDEKGKLLSTAHYGGKAVSLIALGAGGELPRDGVVTYEPNFEQTGPRKVQTQSRPHWSKFSSDGRYLQVTDLGGDRLWILRIARSPLGLSVHQELKFPAGYGPRHMDVDMTSGRGYVNGELSSEIAWLNFNQADQRYDLAQIYPTLGNADKEPANNTSEVRLHPNGKFIYVGNRGHDSISVFAVDAESGALSPVEREAVRGIWPRNFNISPAGHWMIVAGQFSDSLTVFSIDESSGELTFNRQMQTVLSPTRVLFGRD
jgi:6-phosphogluconolactonase